jgi:hypothetical protein
MELEAEVQKLKEQNEELQKKQVYTILYHLCTFKEYFLSLVRKRFLLYLLVWPNANCSNYFTDFVK